MTLCRAPAKAVFYMLTVATLMAIRVGPAWALSPEAMAPQHSLPAPLMGNDSINFAQSGSIKLTWQSTGDDGIVAGFDFVLEEATSPDFVDARTYYHGPDLATYISGLPEGTYYYRVRLQNSAGGTSEWSRPIVVEVEHQSLSLAWFLFAVGGLVFALTVFVVVSGTRNDRNAHGRSSGRRP